MQQDLMIQNFMVHQFTRKKHLSFEMRLKNTIYQRPFIEYHIDE
jgi:hypothetical protein